MEEPDGSYAPESPDLSAYHSAPVQPVHHSYALRSNQSSATPSQRLFETLPSNQRYGGAPSGQMPFSEAPDAMEDGPTSGSPEPRLLRKPSRRNQSEGEIDVKTKFPVARIKRIMQADEDVGKVSQVTPIAVSKALELFMISLVSKAAGEARAASSKRITTKHLKQAVAKEEEYDFLQEIISKVPEAPAGDDKGEQGDGDEPKRRRGAAKGKRKASEEF